MSKWMPTNEKDFLCGHPSHPSGISPRDMNGPLKVIPVPYWDVVSAIDYLQSVIPQAYDLGYNLALGGGVLNNGFSTNDLDIIAMPRAIEEVCTLALLDLFRCPKPALFVHPPLRLVFRVDGPRGRPPIDLILFTQTQDIKHELMEVGA